MSFSPRVFQEIFAGMVGRLTSSTPLTDLNQGSVFTTMLEAAAQEDDEQYFAMLDIIRSYSLDTTTGADLDARATEYGITRLPDETASTFVTLGDTAVTKVVTNVYSGLPGAAAGTFSINGSALTGFTPTGSIIVGRGTPNAETVAYTSITNNTTYVTFNLSGAFANDHGTDETIILSQGGARTFVIGTIVKVPASDISPEIDYSLDAQAIILDGESVVMNVSVTATVAGAAANVPIGSIIAFDSAPFATATVTNPARVTNGRDVEDDNDLRDRIKSTIQSLSRGTGQSIITGVTGLVSTTDNKRVVSCALIEPTTPANVVKLFIDDGTGFIPSWIDVGVETVVSNATGGEKYLSTSNVPVVKAFVETQNSGPYALNGGETLFVVVGGLSETINFSSTDFATPGAATAQEVLTKINATATLFESRISSGGDQVRIFSLSNNQEQIQVTGGTANAILNFPTDTKYSMKLYRTRNNVVQLLSKDGITASIESGDTEAYNFSQKRQLCVVVDEIYTQPQLVWFQPTDFGTPSTVTAAQVIAIMNKRLSGASSEVSSNSTKVTLISNTQLSASSAVRIVETFTYANLNATTDISTTISTGHKLFNASGDYLYLGHSLVPFESIYFNLSILASATITPVWQFWNGTTSAWTTFHVYDETAGLTVSPGNALFRLPIDWAPTVVNGQTAFWIRIQASASPSTFPTGYAKICSANEIFGFPQTVALGANNDYQLNRYIGQIGLSTPLLAGDNLSIGSFDTEAQVTSIAGPYALFGGETLNVTIDGVSESVTFLSGDFVTPGAAVPSEVVTKLSKILTGVTASTINGAVEIQTNNSSGSVQVTGGTANSILQFPTTLFESLPSHVPAVVSTPGPFAFNPGDNITIVMDENAANNFTTPCTYPSTFTAGSSSPADTTLYSGGIFPTANQVNGFDMLFTKTYFLVIQDLRYQATGANKSLTTVTYTTGGTAGSEVVTVTGTSISVQIQSGVSTATQIRTAVLASAPAMVLLSAVVVSGTGSNTQVAASIAPLAFQRIAITAYAVPTGVFTLASTPTITPVTGDTYEIAPHTAAEVVALWSNKRVTLITTQASVMATASGAVQLSSLNAGETAAVEVPGGPGNVALGFPTAQVIGIDGYKYFSGLAQITQWTVDGRTSDPTDYPGIRAAGVQVEVAEPISVPVSVNVTVSVLQGVTLDSISNDISSAISGYINALSVGSDVVVSEIIVAVMDVTGVSDVQVSEPAANIAIAFNQLARANAADIIVG